MWTDPEDPASPEPTTTEPAPTPANSNHAVTARILTIKALIEAGEYEVDRGKLAEAIVDDELGPKKR